MRGSYRFVFLFLLIAGAVTGAIQAHFEKKQAVVELSQRLDALGSGVAEAVANTLADGRGQRLSRMLRQFNKDPHISVLVCSAGKVVAVDNSASHWASLCESPMASPTAEKLSLGNQNYLAVERKVDGEIGGRAFWVVLVHSLSEIEVQARRSFFRTLMTILFAGAIAGLLFKVFTYWFLRRSMQYIVRWSRSVFRVGKVHEVSQRLPEEFRELTKELSSMALRLRHERKLSDDRLRLVWNADAMNKVQEMLRGRRLIIVANREPYIHDWVETPDGKKEIRVQRPASGVVTALEPVMRVSRNGIWVAHGSGSADRDMVNRDDEVLVPPENPSFTLRRVWLTAEEENGYYYGFSNEGLWPLCHLAYTRPIFRLSDWEIYKAVNQKFAEKTLKGISPENSVVLVQDYHYALLPRMLRERAPGLSIELFWHIPWPNPEAFGICPQFKELLEGMLGADVVGFHTQFHCNNFLETCDRYLECRVDWERFSVTIGNRETLVRSYPISIATEPVPRISAERRKALREKYGITTAHVALGVDRLDYTKGLVERLSGVERFFEKYPAYIGKLTFVEMGTPSRTNIASYRALITEVEAAVQRVNTRFEVEAYKPIILLKGHFDWKDVAEFYQLGQICLVTSLHDGMNLVAKEYVWSQSPDEGALILSRFTGAARELSDAFIVNPYSSEEIADAIYNALHLSRDERMARMQRMREKVRSHNAFHWATDLIGGVSGGASAKISGS